MSARLPAVPRRSWLEDKSDLLLEEVSASGMHLDRQRAAELITERVRAEATAVGVTEPTARRYLDDQTLRDMARRMLFEFVDEQPGADLLQVPRTAPMSLILVGTTIAALAEAADRVGHIVATYKETLSGLGQIMAQTASGQVSNSQEIMLPPALLRPVAKIGMGGAITCDQLRS
jgi:hypothetical protein